MKFVSAGLLALLVIANANADRIKGGTKQVQTSVFPDISSPSVVEYLEEQDQSQPSIKTVGGGGGFSRKVAGSSISGIQDPSNEGIKTIRRKIIKTARQRIPSSNSQILQREPIARPVIKTLPPVRRRPITKSVIIEDEPGPLDFEQGGHSGSDILTSDGQVIQPGQEVIVHGDGRIESIDSNLQGIQESAANDEGFGRRIKTQQDIRGSSSISGANRKTNVDLSTHISNNFQPASRPNQQEPTLIDDITGGTHGGRPIITADGQVLQPGQEVYIDEHGKIVPVDQISEIPVAPVTKTIKTQILKEAPVRGRPSFSSGVSSGDAGFQHSGIETISASLPFQPAPVPAAPAPKPAALKPVRPALSSSTFSAPRPVQSSGAISGTGDSGPILTSTGEVLQPGREVIIDSSGQIIPVDTISASQPARPALISQPIRPILRSQPIKPIVRRPVQTPNAFSQGGGITFNLGGPGVIPSAARPYKPAPVPKRTIIAPAQVPATRYIAPAPAPAPITTLIAPVPAPESVPITTLVAPAPASGVFTSNTAGQILTSSGQILQPGQQVFINDDGSIVPISEISSTGGVVSPGVVTLNVPQPQISVIRPAVPAPLPVPVPSPAIGGSPILTAGGHSIQPGQEVFVLSDGSIIPATGGTTLVHPVSTFSSGHGLAFQTSPIRRPYGVHTSGATTGGAAPGSISFHLGGGPNVIPQPVRPVKPARQIVKTTSTRPGGITFNLGDPSNLVRPATAPVRTVSTIPISKPATYPASTVYGSGISGGPLLNIGGHSIRPGQQVIVNADGSISPVGDVSISTPLRPIIRDPVRVRVPVSAIRPASRPSSGAGIPGRVTFNLGGSNLARPVYKPASIPARRPTSVIQNIPATSGITGPIIGADGAPLLTAGGQSLEPGKQYFIVDGKVIPADEAHSQGGFDSTYPSAGRPAIRPVIQIDPPNPKDVDQQRVQEEDISGINPGFIDVTDTRGGSVPTRGLNDGQSGGQTQDEEQFGFPGFAGGAGSSNVLIQDQVLV